MKRLLSVIVLILLFIMGHLISLKFTSTQSTQMSQKTDKILTVTSFRQIKEYILTHGDRKIYCNRYNDNPHIALKDMDIYLNPDDWHNFNCDPKLSDFNEMVIYIKRSGYYGVKFDGSKLVVDEFTKPEELEKLFKKALLEIEQSS